MMKLDGRLALVAWMACWGGCAAAPVVPAGIVSGGTPSRGDDLKSPCSRMCGVWAACAGSGFGRCDADCERDRALLDPSFFLSFVGCVATELEPARCPQSPGGPQERVTFCYGAALEAHAHEGEARVRTVVAAICRRAGRCPAMQGGTATDEKGCTDAVLAATRDAAVGRLLMTTRDELMMRVSRCLDERPCSEAETVSRCLDEEVSRITRAALQSPGS